MMDFLFNSFKYDNNLEVIGLTDELNSLLVVNKFNNSNKSIILLTSSLYEANMYYDRLSLYTDKVLLFPMDDFISSVALAISPELKIKRLEVIERINNKEKLIVVTNVMGFLRFLPDKNNSSKLKFELSKGLNINRDNLIKLLDEFGYGKETFCLSTGDYSVRGFVVDIFLIKEIHPIRIEFFGNEIESIRYFDENSQASIEDIDKIQVLPINEIKTTNNSSLYDYLDDPYVFYVDEVRINNEIDKIKKDVNDYKKEKNIKDKLMFNISDININNIMYLNHFGNKHKKSIDYNVRAIDNFNSNMELLKDYVNKCINSNKIVIFYLSRIKEIDAISKLFPSVKTIKNVTNSLDNGVYIINKKINNGFEYDKYVIISEYDIEKINKVNNIKYKNTLKIGKKIKDYNQLEVGDYIVHYAHGIGVYMGINTLEKNGLKKDYLQINYLGNDKIYVPVEKVDSIFKYSSKDGETPKINKLNSISWENTKRVLKKKIHDISKQLLKLYAERKRITGPSFKDDLMDELFASSFGYELTTDQIKSINDIYKDLESSNPMDRLLCGDVGFGKTEVAFRAMFRTISNHYMVAYLCPTTILSKQQYEKALDRFKDFPVNIRLLNRFTTNKEKDEIINGIKDGKVDIVFGTHRLLSNDINFKNLGLLVVDEEQRFGVTHKEKIKELKNNVNVLTLSATPIPRTLKMSLTGLRDLSIIDTAPVNRYPIQTYVIAQNNLLIKDAINKELARNGQVFILYNRVESIESRVYEIQSLVPNARITYAHGKMNKTELENVMNSFVNYDYDILVSTTIIETGIDIPNANTLIVFDADRFGLSQLYQLRGRVGRSNRIAYAYLMYRENKMLNDIAVKRLEAIKEFTELGSGYRIAMRDLSLRGAGDVLGSEQAGFVDVLGIDLYMKLIDEEIKRLNGVEVEQEEVDTKSLVDVETHIDDSYVDDDEIKIEIHQKINEIDSYDKLIEIKNELEDRFGKVNDTLLIYMYEEWFEKLCNKLDIKNITQTSNYIEINVPSNVTKLVKFDKIFMLSYDICSKFSFKAIGNNVLIKLPIKTLDKHFIYYCCDLLNMILEEVNNVK